MRRLLGLRNVRVFIAGWTLSVFGDWAMFIVLGVWTKDLTGSNSAAGLVFFALGVPSLLAPFAGLLVDRLPRRPLLIGIYAAEAIVILSLLFVHDRGDVWIIYAVTVFYGAAGTFGASARSALMTVMVPRELLAESNGVLQTLREGLRLIAPLVGALIYASGGGGAVAILDSASFVAVVIALAVIRLEEPRFERVEHHFVTELLAGARHVFATLPLRQIVLTTGVCLLVVGFAETLIFAVLDQGLGRPASFFGVLSSLQGLGAIAGGLIAARTMRRIGDVRLVGVGMVLFAVGELSFASHSLALVLTGIAVGGAGLAWIIVGYATAVQVRTPLRLQGRVLSAADALVSTPQTISIALGAALVSVVDYRLLVVAMAIVVVACGAYLLTRQPEPAPGQDPVFA
ncbi:MAG: MFS transporter [Actinobacteria bacterium]|nr:MAG: MFS transporter [Actinomycetota bacterium]